MEKRRLSDRRIIMQISLEKDVYEEFKNILHKCGYVTVNEFIREKVRELIREAGGEKNV
jgi:metal-responsive CopG/Arc/MetJ family transcriptional regulator